MKASDDSEHQVIIPCCQFALQFWLKSEPWPTSAKSTAFRVFDPFCMGCSIAWIRLHVGDDLALFLLSSGVVLVGISGIWLYSLWFGVEEDWTWEKD
jgi:hypothetical protein